MSITWNGISSDTIGVIVERIPNRYVPTRRFSPQQVAGRNGNILLVDKSFPNVEQEYEVYLSAEAQGLPSVARACAEWLMGPDGYCRLQDSYDTTVYREAFLMGGYDLENILNKFGRCTITFSCKPQKYLLTGDTPIEIPAGSTTTYTGSTVQFDGITGASITSLSATISPIQDLHGYSSPWPAGGGVNMLDYSTASVSDTGVSFSGGIYLAANQAYTFSYYGTSNVVIIAYVHGTSTRLFTTGYLKTYTFTPTEDVVADITYYNSTGITSAENLFQAEKGSISHDWSPYSNICPITGRTGVDVQRTGINVWDEQWEVGQYNATTGDKQYNANRIRCKNLIPVKGGKDYYLVISSATSDVYIIRCYYDENGNFLNGANSRSRLFSVPVNACFVAFSLDNSYGATYQNDISLNYPSTATTYEPYNGNTYAVDWTSQAGTVYGGTLDVVTGVLTVDRIGVDGGSVDWTKVTGNQYRNFSFTPSPLAKYLANRGTVISSQYKSETNNTAGASDDNYVWIRGSSTNNTVCVKDTSKASLSASDFKTAMSGVQFVYELATPITYQLTAQEIEVLVGENNVWTSSGPVSVTVEAPFVGTVTNPTPFEARPMLEVSGVGEITINGKTIQILESVSDFEIDCETMEAEDNSKIYCMDFPELSGGENEIVGDGSITALTVTPRWWTL